MAERTFTLEEAQSLLPVLESLLRSCMESKRLIAEADAELQQAQARVFVNGGSFVDIIHLSRRKAQREKSLQQLKDSIAEIDSAGVQVKDLDIGLLDFPCRVENETILLCWKLGERSITHWHGLEEGFRGRKPIDERIANAKKRSH